MGKARTLTVHQSLVGTITWGGGDRRLVISLWVLVVVLLIPPWHPVKFGLAATLGIAGHAFLVWMQKQDPKWLDVYLLSLGYADYYPAWSHVKAVFRKRHPSIPRNKDVR